MRSLGGKVLCRSFNACPGNGRGQDYLFAFGRVEIKAGYIGLPDFLPVLLDVLYLDVHRIERF